jgi:hypothetical protein
MSMTRSRLNAPSLFLLAFVLWVIPCSSNADDSVAYRVVIVGDPDAVTSIGTGEGQKVIGTYGSWEEASAAAMKWATDHPNNYSLWRIDTVKGGKTTSYGETRNLESARQAVAALKAIRTRPERPLSAYKDAVKEAYRRVKNAKETLTSETQRLTKKNVQDINNLIADFNREAATYNSAAGSAGLDRVETISPITTTITFQEPKFVDVGPPPGSSSPSLSGKKYSGTIGRAKATIEFKNGSFAVSGDIEGQGRWRQDGNGVHFETESSVYRGVVSGDGIKGYRYFKDHRPYERWAVTLDRVPEKLKAVGVWKSGVYKVEIYEGGSAKNFNGTVGTWAFINDRSFRANFDGHFDRFEMLGGDRAKVWGSTADVQEYEEGIYTRSDL